LKSDEVLLPESWPNFLKEPAGHVLLLGRKRWVKLDRQELATLVGQSVFTLNR
jgi:hypothetical protein